jgi:MULE transposase domain
MIQTDTFREVVKQQVRDDPSRPVKRAYDATASSVARGGYLRLSRSSIPEFHHVRTCVSRAKREEVPHIPRQLADVNVAGVWAKSWNDVRFLLHEDTTWGILVFSTDENLRFLNDCKDVFIDGTFRTSPKPFHQYVTIHGYSHKRALPLVHCLLSGKTIGHYRQLLQVVKQNVRRVSGRNFKPKRLVSDFELSIITAVETELPRTRIFCCLFHLRQSMFRKLTELGLRQAYKNDAVFRRLVSRIMSIGFLPLALVRLNFTNFRNGQSVVNMCARYNAFAQLLTYVNNTYFVGRFTPAMWNCFERNTANRTNNFVEGNVWP